MNTAVVKILLVEDSASDADVLQEMLRQTGPDRYEFTWVERLDEALARVGREAFDVLLLDLSLPDSTGPDTFLRARHTAPQVPIVVLTGAEDETLGLEAVRHGVQDYLVKGRTDGRQVARAIRYAIERQQVEEALRQSEEKFSVAFAQNPSAIALTRLDDGVFLDVNDTWVALNGYSRDEVIGRSARQMQLWPTADAAMSFVEELKSTGSLRGWEQEFVKKSGEVFIAQLSAQVLTVRGEKVILTTLVDITQRKRAETEIGRLNQELERRVTELQAIFATAPIGLAIAEDASGHHIRGNRANEEIFGLPAGGELSKAGPQPARFRIFQDRRELAVAELPMQRAIRGETVSGMLLDSVLEDGRVISLYACCAPLLDEGGRPRGAVGAFLDITPLKVAEQALRRAKEEWERTFDSVPDMIAIVDDKHRILRANRAMAERLGCTPEQCIGEVCYKCVHGTDAPPALCPHVQTLADGRGHVAEIHEERLRGDFLVSTTPLLDERGERLGAVHVARDITGRKQAEEALRKAHEQLERRVAERTAELQVANEELQRAMAEQRRLEAEILETTNRERQRIGQDLHDGLTQQLSGIKYLGETLHEKLAQHVNITPAELARITELLSEAVEQARSLAHGLNPVAVEPTGLMLALERFAGTVREAYKIGCRLDCRESVPVDDNAVATHLYRIAQEAVQNAIKHGKATRVTMRLRDADSLLTLEVRDNGIGIPKELTDHSGIGLRIMQYRARACGGTLILRRGPRGGTWVICSVPHPAASKKRTTV